MPFGGPCVWHTPAVEDIVAVEVSTAGGVVYFVTWGRVQDAVDPEPLEQLILASAPRFAIPGTPVSARLCASLQEARDAFHFYEALFEFAQRPIPFGSDYETWRARTDDLMRQGKEIYYAGMTRGVDR